MYVRKFSEYYFSLRRYLHLNKIEDIPVETFSDLYALERL